MYHLPLGHMRMHLFLDMTGRCWWIVVLVVIVDEWSDLGRPRAVDRKVIPALTHLFSFASLLSLEFRSLSWSHWMQSIMVNNCGAAGCSGYSCSFLDTLKRQGCATVLERWISGFCVVPLRLRDGVECHCNKLWTSGCISLCLYRKEVFVYCTYIEIGWWVRYLRTALERGTSI